MAEQTNPQGETQGAPKKKGTSFSISKFISVVIRRQKEKNSHTVVIIYAPPRTGKTTLGLKLLIEYIKQKRKQFKSGETKWDPPRSWRVQFKEYFAGDAGDMNRKIKNNPEESYDFVDEGGDVVSWQHQMEAEQRDLIELLLKAGKKKMLTIIIIPSMSLLNKVILSLAHYLFMIPHEPYRGQNTALLFRNYENPILREKIPFGFKNIEADVLKHRHLSDRDNFIKYLVKKDRFITKFEYYPLEEKLYALYDRLVKDPQIMKDRKKGRVVPFERYKRLEYALDTMMYNLFGKGTHINAIETLLRDKFGTSLVSRAIIRSHIDRITVMQAKPNAQTEVFSEEAPVSTEDSVAGLHDLECDIDSPEDGDDSEEE